MRIYQYRDYLKIKIAKIHVVDHSNSFLCGKPFSASIDINDLNKIDFSKGICKMCNRLYKNRYKKDLNFEVIKLKLGIKNVNRSIT